MALGTPVICAPISRRCARWSATPGSCCRSSSTPGRTRSHRPPAGQRAPPAGLERSAAFTSSARGPPSPRPIDSRWRSAVTTVTSTPSSESSTGPAPCPLVVLCPHFDPDTAPTGGDDPHRRRARGAGTHELHVVTSLPWYREHRSKRAGTGRLVRTEQTSWGSITRVHPFPGPDKRNLLRRAARLRRRSRCWPDRQCLRVGGWFRRSDAVMAMSPPLTLGLTGWIASRSPRGRRWCSTSRTCSPTPRSETGAITNRRIIAAASWLERVSYRRPTRSRSCQRRPARQRRGEAPSSPPSATAAAPQGARDPELRRHRGDRPGRSAHPVPA
jgi:hypothetical protein